MRRLVFALLLAILPKSLCAKTIALQMTEHQNYTRLVISLTNTTAWAIEKKAGGLDIKVEAPVGLTSDSISTLATSKYIKSANVTRNGDLVEITFDCDCDSNYFLMGSTFLVVDITIQSTQVTDGITQIFPHLLSRPWHANQLGVFQRPQIAVNVNSIDSTVSSGIARATYAGFLQVSENNAGQQFPPADLRDTDDSQIGIMGIGIQSQINGPIAPNPIEKKFPCEQINNLLLSKWQSTDSFNSQVSEIHRNIADELDENGETALLNLVILHVGNGLGMESNVIIQSLGKYNEILATLNYIGETLDTSTVPLPIGLESCENDLIFWSFLNDQHLRDLGSFDPRMLILAYKSLPNLLRARLRERFITALEDNNLTSYVAEIETHARIGEFVEASPQEQTLPSFYSSRTPSILDQVRKETFVPQVSEEISKLNGPRRLDANLLDTVIFERRATGTTAPIVQNALSQHIAKKRFGAALSLASSSAGQLFKTDNGNLAETHLVQAFTEMSDADIIAFSFKDDRPLTSPAVERLIEDRLSQMNMSASTTVQSNDETPYLHNTLKSQGTNSQHLRIVEEISKNTDNLLASEEIPSHAESSQLLSSSQNLRNTILPIIAGDM